jgi:hypothetical protein
LFYEFVFKPKFLNAKKGEFVHFIKSSFGYYACYDANRKVGYIPSSFLTEVDPKEKGECLYNYGKEPPELGYLSVKKGDKVRILSKNKDWWLCECNGCKGLFPSNYLKVLPSTLPVIGLPPPPPPDFDLPPPPLDFPPLIDNNDLKRQEEEDKRKREEEERRKKEEEERRKREEEERRKREEEERRKREEEERRKREEEERRKKEEERKRKEEEERKRREEEERKWKEEEERK